LEREAAKVGLKINEPKTRNMIAAWNKRTIRDLEQSVAIGDKHFEVEFVYLGSLMTLTNANMCFFGLAKHLQSSYLSCQTKFTIHNTMIHPVLLYGSETWVLTKREENQLLVFERKILRTICGPKIDNRVYMRN
jgi:hypothetical protein